MNAISDTYRSIAAPAKGIYKELGSKFLAFAHPVETEDQAKEILAAVRKEYFDARHHCFAWRLGLTGEPYRLSDDGEPSSTAGRPIHGQLLSQELSDILVVVVRYFGGVKLGVPGLIRAYRTATQDALANAQIVEKVAGEHFTLKFGYLQMNDVMKVLKDMGITPLRQSFDLDCSLEVRVRLSQIEDFRKQLSFCQIIVK
ncbi:MAG: YigZ family protein [Bacteroidales bacterium]|nr:YigZ family protein [Bacteroidales bacterium]